jgi:starch phosphorylase
VETAARRLPVAYNGVYSPQAGGEAGARAIRQPPDRTAVLDACRGPDAEEERTLVIQKYTVVPRLPVNLRPLLDIARNLWWVWSRNAVALFRRIDSDLWEDCQHNPIKLLGSLHPQRLMALAADDAFVAHMESVQKELQDYLAARTWYRREYEEKMDLRIAYFSAEFGLHECMPIYSGGLGVLAGEHIKSSGELGLPLVGVGLSYQQGYNHQYLSSDGWQLERYPDSDFYNMPMTLMRDEQAREITIDVVISSQRVHARIWKVQVGRTSLYLLDANLPSNEANDRLITSRLYGGDVEMRIRQEILLGIGGMRALHQLGYFPNVCHMNEGHSAFLAVERIRLLMQSEGLGFEEAREALAPGNIFTTHTPVPAGNDRFPPEMMERYFRDYVPLLGISMDTFLGLGRENPSDAGEPFCMTVLALRLSSHANGVSELHGKTARRMWKRIWPSVPEREIPVGHVTNGVHGPSWLSDEFGRLFERYLGPRWQRNPADLDAWQPVGDIPDNELWRAKERLRDRLVTYVRKRLRGQPRSGSSRSIHRSPDEILDPEVLTIGFARRFATYKRANLILRDAERLRKILMDKDRPVQIVFAGKAHPHDHPGKDIIRQIAQLARSEEFHHRLVFLEDYDIDVARQLLQGVDVWLNTPLRPLEASGTSGMKAALNGALNLSTLDGWWCEAFTGDNGWAIGSGEVHEQREYQDLTESTVLYDLLEQEVIPLFYRRGPDGVPREWIARMKASIRSICPFFNTNRMVREYTERFYLQAAIQGSMLSKDGYAAARMLALWKRRVGSLWHETLILSVDAETSAELEVGGQLELKVRVLLGSLAAEEVSVEVLFGPMDSHGEIAAGDPLPLGLSSSEGSVAVYTGAVPCLEPGQHAFAVRILPFRRELANKFETRRVTWWCGNSTTPAESVAERLSAVRG